jgi:protein involved in polysaccharide export with SLBB domain
MKIRLSLFALGVLGAALLCYVPIKAFTIVNAGVLAPTSQPSPDPRKSRQIKPGDELVVTVADLNGDNTGNSVMPVRVQDDGKIKLKYIDPVKVAGGTLYDAAESVIQAYADAKLISSANVGVEFGDAADVPATNRSK